MEMNLESILQKGKRFLRNAVNIGLASSLLLMPLSCGGDGPTRPPPPPPKKVEQQTNRAPSITSIPIKSVDERSSYQYEIKASDADENVLNYRLVDSPNWLQVSNNFVFGTAPEVLEDKVFPVKVRVSDGKGGDTDQQFDITVKNLYNVHELSISQLEGIMSVDEGRIAFSDNVNFSQGDIIIGGISDKTPNGILRKVESVSGNTLLTEPATFEEVYRDSTFNFTQEISLSEARLSKIAASLGVREIHISGYDRSYEFSDVKMGSNGDNPYYGNLILNGSVSFDKPILNLGASFRERSLRGQVTINERADLRLSSKAGFLVHSQESFPLLYIPPIPIPGSPVVVTPIITIDALVSAGTSASLEARVTQEGNFRPGIEYENSWRNISSFSNEFSSYIQFDSGKANLSIYAGPSLKFHINDYGLVSPSIGAGVTGGIKIEGESSTDWKLYGTADARFVIDPGRFFRLFIPPYTKPMIKVEKLLKENKVRIPDSSVEPPSQSPPEGGFFVDPRDGQRYKTVKIGNQVWMAENMNLDFRRNGSYLYEDNASYGEVYGRLYNFDAARRACGEGWHLPHESEWWTLFEFLGGNTWEGVGGKMKSIEGWDSPNTGATNESGFSALPGGMGKVVGHIPLEVAYNGLGRGAYFWSRINNDTAAFAKAVFYSTSEVGIHNHLDSRDVQIFSVRCVRD